jgi:predicted nucleic acid-binding protein
LSNHAYLLDTNVVSEGRRKVPNVRVAAFMRSIRQEDSFVSVLTIGELRKGAEMRRRTDPDGADSLGRWIDDVEAKFGSCILTVDLATARVWGELSAVRPRAAIDTLIAATAIVRDLTLVTRNTREVADTGVDLVDPWSD